MSEDEKVVKKSLINAYNVKEKDLEEMDAMTKAGDLAELDKYKSQLKDALSKLKEHRKKYEKNLMKEMSEKGVNSIKVNGRTIYFHNQYWASYIENKQDAVQALKEAGLDSYVNETYNTHSLSAYFRERIQEKEEEEGEPVMDPEEVMPPELKDKIEITERTQLRSRSS